MGGRRDVLLRAGLDAVVPVLTLRLADVDRLSSYGYVRNRSNDIYEDYSTHVFTIGVRAGF